MPAEPLHVSVVFEQLPSSFTSTLLGLESGHRHASTGHTEGQPCQDMLQTYIHLGSALH